MNFPFEWIALVCIALFSGAAIYITFVEHPARLRCNSAVAVAQWRPSYKRATVMQVPLAVIGCMSAAAAYYQSHAVLLLVAGLILASVVPFTLLIIRPTNLKLTNLALEPAAPETMKLLRRWGKLHAVRTMASSVAFVLMVIHFCIRD